MRMTSCEPLQQSDMNEEIVASVLSCKKAVESKRFSLCTGSHEVVIYVLV